MSQNDFNISNQGFPATRADLNSALQALASNSAGATEPSTTYAYQLWYDSSTNLFKMRNADNNGWITLALFDQTADEWEVRTSAVQTADLDVDNDAEINGLTVGRGAGDVDTNTAVGASTLNDNTTGSKNLAVGWASLFENTTGSYNTASGYAALFKNTEGSANSATGFEALRNNTTGSNNTASGHQALYNNTEGDSNTASGYRSLYSNTTGSENTALGYDAQAVSSTADNQIAIRAGATKWYSSAGSPESVVTAGVGSMYTNSTGGAGTTLYVKESGTGNTGWVAK